MIGKREIIDAAASQGLNPHVVEKDYALGWLLWGIFSHEGIRGNWMFKGGTCLKKCFFETYRFSEDLDFTLTERAHADADFLATAFEEIGACIYERTGLEFPPDAQAFDIHENRQGQLICQGRIGYQGPVSPRGRSMPRIKLDLTADERIVLAPVRLPVLHPYSDMPDGGIAVQSYAYEEVFGEKVRALAERARPRDLYDVVHLFRNAESRPDAAVLGDVLRRKCEFKDMPFPSLAQIEAHRPLLESGWAHMLAHQLPALPPVTAFWSALPDFFAWLEGRGTAQPLRPYAATPGETTIRERIALLPIPITTRSHLEIICFAAANRLCIDLGYQGSSERIEPYSLRYTGENEIILHAHSVDEDRHRRYRIDRIEKAEVADRVFTPRRAIELTQAGPLPLASAPKCGVQDSGSNEG